MFQTKTIYQRIDKLEDGSFKGEWNGWTVAVGPFVFRTPVALRGVAEVEVRITWPYVEVFRDGAKAFGIDFSEPENESTPQAPTEA